MSIVPSNTIFSFVSLVALAGSACLDPLVSDEVAEQGLVLPAETSIPSVSDKPEYVALIADNDGVDGVVPLLNAFAEGAPTHFWDFGPTPDFAAPIFVVVRKNAMGSFEKTGHPPIIDAIPGQPSYSPYWTLIYLEVTDAYDGEIIPSFAAVEEAQALGLVKAPLIDGAVDCPIVAKDVRLEVGGGSEPVAPVVFYWAGMKVWGYDFGLMPVTQATIVPEESVYVISREGQTALSEPLRGVDITGDSDTNDTNNVFISARSNENYTPLCRRVHVTVPSDIAKMLIDTTGDESSTEINAASDLFVDGNPVVGTVVAFEASEDNFHCVQQLQEGGF